MASVHIASKDDTIRLNMEAFLPYICNCIQLTDLLTQIHNYTKEQRKELFNVSKQNNTEACRRALHLLVNEFHEPGRFVAFKEAMATRGYPVIVKLLEGEYVPFNANCQKVIDLFTSTLIPNLNPEEILPFLESQETLQANDAEEVRAEAMNHGRQRACWLLLFHLPNRVENWFRNFMEALIDARYAELAQRLEPDMYEKIMTQRHSASNLNHSVEVLASGIALNNDIEGSTIEKEEFEVGEKYSVQLHATPAPKSISFNGSVITNGDHCNENVDGKGDNCILALKFDDMTINMKQNESKLAGNKHVLQSTQYESHREDRLTQLKDLTRLEQDETHLKMPVGTEPKVEDKVTNKGKLIQYDRKFLLSLRDSARSNTCTYWKEIEKFKDIVLPKTLPRKLETSAKSRSSSTGENTIETYVRSVDTIPRRELVSDSTEGNIKSEIQPQIFENDLESGDGGNVENTDESSIANAVTATENNADNQSMGTINTKSNLKLTNAPDIDIRQNSEGQGEDQDPSQSLNFDFLLNDSDSGVGSSAETLHGHVPDFTDEESFGALGGEDVYQLPEKTNVDDSQELHFDELNDFNLKINNVLDIKVTNDDDEYMEFNIKTDSDDVDEIEDKDVSLREYQKELAKEGCAGDNVIVMAPTNTGKTRVAFRIMQEHLRTQRRQQKIGRVIFLVENEALALQQGKACAKTLPAYRTKIITGSLQRDKQHFLKDFVDRRDILIVTAQVLLNALILKEIPSLTTFSMIVFDECHHTNNNHRFNEIMSRYMDVKLDKNPDIDSLPQIVGLTASVGVGGNVSEDLAKKHMKEILANLDAKHLCTVRLNKEELQRFENNPKERIVTAHRRRHDLYRDAILQIMAHVDEYMVNHPAMATIPKKDEFIKAACRVPQDGGTQQFQQWLSEFATAIGKVRSSDICSLLNPCREHLEVYNKALMIHADARRKDAETILEMFMTYQAVIESKMETEVTLMGLYNGLKQEDFSDEPENPKLLKLQEIILPIYDNDDDARGIIFVKTRELADALTHWMKETPRLRSLNATEFVGQAAPAARGGTTKSRQKDVLEYFKGGRHKIVIATSVAEEGLDITKCNLVIRYEHVTNEIVRLQSRGRARAKDSRYYVITEEGSWIVAKEEKNAMLERLMNRLIPVLQVYIEDHPNTWERELTEIQTTKKYEELRKAQEQKKKLTADVMELRCFNCNNFICFSSDLRKIQNSHHVAIEEEVTTRVISKRDPHPQFVDNELKFDGEVFCGQPNCQHTLGGICEYKHAEFPLFSIKHFRVVDKNGKSQRFKKWKLANFEPEPFTLDDLREVVERLRARNE